MKKTTRIGLFLSLLALLVTTGWAQTSQPNAIRLFRTGDRFITLTDSSGTTYIGTYPDNQIFVRRGGRGLIELGINGASDYYLPAKLLNGSGQVWGASVNAALLAWNSSASTAASLDKTYSSGVLTVSTTLVSLPALPASASRVILSVSGADIVYSTDPSNGPVASPLYGYRLADGQTQIIAASDAPNLRMVRLISTDARVLYEIKTTLR